jgi:hypothetical protein
VVGQTSGEVGVRLDELFSDERAVALGDRRDPARNQARIDALVRGQSVEINGEE